MHQGRRKLRQFNSIHSNITILKLWSGLYVKRVGDSQRDAQLNRWTCISLSYRLHWLIRNQCTFIYVNRATLRRRINSDWQQPLNWRAVHEFKSALVAMSASLSTHAWVYDNGTIFWYTSDRGTTRELIDCELSVVVRKMNFFVDHMHLFICSFICYQ